MTQLAAKMYCKWLSAKTGRYYRLPTEAEWEYACRAGTKTAFSFGDDPAELEDHGWFFDNSDESYHEVGQKKPNPWGLHDMHGNVAEWTLSSYRSYPYEENDGRNAAADRAKKVVRGGSWYDRPKRCRSAFRLDYDPWQKIYNVGFRVVVREIKVPTSE
jgi:formylglycine-generating enzyme required for sulfatase activity